MLVAMLTFYEEGAAAGKSIETILLKYYQTFDFNTCYILQCKIKKLFYLKKILRGYQLQ
jgi:SET domain-containing protein